MPEPKPEHPSTYFVQDRSSQEELNRLQAQDQLLTVGMGGVLPEQADPTAFQRVLDVGCGTGGWLIEAAQASPTMKFVGVDVSTRVLNFARAQAEAAQVSDRVEFHMMDALRMLEFPDDAFDLVNQRLGQGYLRTWDWRKLLQEYQRVCRTGGTVRITEGDTSSESNSPALLRLQELLMHAFYQAGNLFTEDHNGLTAHLADLLSQHGFLQVQTRSITLEYRRDSPLGQLFYEDMKRLFRTIVPFLQKRIRVPDDYEETYQQMLNEMQAPDFFATGHLVTAWGVVPASEFPDMTTSY